MWQILLVMAVAGFGVGGVFAANPTLIVASVPASETGSAMSFNQVLRNIGFSVGSALAGVILSVHTPVGATFPALSWLSGGAVCGRGDVCRDAGTEPCATKCRTNRQYRLMPDRC